MLKEISEPKGAVIEAGAFQLGDPTISLLELWGAEYQESNAILIQKKDRDLLEKLAERERCPIAFVGRITGDGKVCPSGCFFCYLRLLLRYSLLLAHHMRSI